MRKTQAAYDAEKVAALAVLERAFGRDATIPHDLAAAVLPVLPEWSAPTRLPRPSPFRDPA